MLRPPLRPPTRSGSDGFTLIELMVVVSIIAILASMAAPSFSSFIQNYRLSTAANAFISDLQLARSEAARRNTSVTVCASADGTTCSNSWLNGRIIFVDADGDGAAGATELIRVSTAPEGLAQATVSGFTGGTIVLRSTGQANVAGSIALCDERAGNFGRAVNLSNVGRPSVTATSCP